MSNPKKYGQSLTVLFSLKYRQGVLPYPKFWATTWPIGTPTGALSAIWFVTLIVIVAVPAGNAFNFSKFLVLCSSLLSFHLSFPINPKPILFPISCCPPKLPFLILPCSHDTRSLHCSRGPSTPESSSSRVPFIHDRCPLLLDCQYILNHHALGTAYRRDQQQFIRIFLCGLIFDWTRDVSLPLSLSP